MLRARAGTALGVHETALLRRLVLARSQPLLDTELPADGLLDWERLLRSANRHRLSPLAARPLLLGSASRRAPVGILERFQNALNLELARAAVHLHHVDEIGAVADREGLEACLLKGAAFARILYQDPGLRPMADLDILVRASDWIRWSESLDALGYTPVDQSDHATCFRRRQSGVFIELHRELTSQASFLGLEVGAVLDRSVRLPSPEGVRLSTLDWEDHLLHLCLHASFQHGFRQPAVNAWDAFRIAERAELDIATFVARANEPRLAPWVYGGLSMCEAVFPHPKLIEARLTLEPAVSQRVARKARCFRPETLLGPDRDAVWGTPVERLAWSGFGPRTFSLLLQISRPPRTTSTEPSPWARLGRITHLIDNHGIAMIRAVWNRRPTASIDPTSASLGEVRDV